MITVLVDNSMSKIEGLPSGSFNRLRQELSYKLNDYFSNMSYHQIKYMIDKKGVFPTGLLPRVKTFLKSNNIPANISDLRIRPALRKPVTLTNKLDPYPDQLKAVDIACQKGQGIVSAVTGSGKSLIIALIAARLNVKTLIVVPNLEIKEQLTMALLELLNDVSNITVQNIDSPSLKTAKKYDLLIIDEAHHVAAKTYANLNKTVWTGIYYRLFFTATPYRNNDNETMLFEGIAGSLIYQLSYKDAVSKGYIVPVESFYVEIPKVKTSAIAWSQVYSELVVNNKDRNQAIATILLNLQQAGISSLCLVKEIKHGNNVQELTSIPFANGQDGTTGDFIKQFSSGKIPSLIGTTGVIGEGVDTKPCEFVLIAGLGKAKSAFMQQVGRAVRKYQNKTSAKIIIFKDKSHKFTTRHFNAQCAILKEEFGVEPIRLELK